MTARHGTSFDFQLFPPSIDADLLTMQMLFRAYEMGSDTEFSNWWDFRREVRRGHIVAGAIYINHAPVAYFGVELMTKPQPWLNLLFYAGRISRPLMREMVHRLYSLLQMYKSELGRSDEVGAVRIVGRPGWRKIAANMGIEMDRRGFVFDNQKGIKNGYVRRFQ
jgi:hypothetical protein